MTVSGYCAECDRLVPLQARGTWAGSRNQRWFPVTHPALGDDSGGKVCEGVRRPL